MKYPLRSHFQTFDEYEAAEKVWIEVCAEIEKRLMYLYRVTETTDQKPDFANRKNVGNFCHIALQKKPKGENFTAIIDTLAQHIVARDGNVLRVAHGVYDGIWALWVEYTSDDAKEKAA